MALGMALFPVRLMELWLPSVVSEFEECGGFATHCTALQTYKLISEIMQHDRRRRQDASGSARGKIFYNIFCHVSGIIVRSCQCLQSFKQTEEAALIFASEALLC